jgi:hypothetical protein
VVGTPSHLGRCVSPLVDKGEDLRVNYGRVSKVADWF